MSAVVVFISVYFKPNTDSDASVLYVFLKFVTTPGIPLGAETPGIASEFTASSAQMTKISFALTRVKFERRRKRTEVLPDVHPSAQQEPLPTRLCLFECQDMRLPDVSHVDPGRLEIRRPLCALEHHFREFVHRLVKLVRSWEFVQDGSEDKRRAEGDEVPCNRILLDEIPCGFLVVTLEIFVRSVEKRASNR